MIKFFTSLMFLALLLTSQGVFAEDDQSVGQLPPPPYCRDEDGQQVCYCLTYELFETLEGVDQLEQMYGTEVDEIYNEFPFFHSELGATLTQGGRAKILYYSPPNLGASKDLTQQVFSQDLDALDPTTIQACQFQKNDPRDFNAGVSGNYNAQNNPYYWSWLWDQQLYFQGSVNRVRPVIIDDQNSIPTLYSIGGQDYTNDAWVKEMKKQQSGGRITSSFYQTFGSLLKVDDTIVHTKQVDRGGEDGPVTVVDYIEYIYGYNAPSGLGAIIESATIENAIMLNDEYMYLFLGKGDELHYQVFKKHTQKPLAPAGGSMSKDSVPYKSCGGENGCVRYNFENGTRSVPTVSTVKGLPGFMNGEYWIPLTEIESLGISKRHAFDIQVLNSQYSKPEGEALDLLTKDNKDGTGDALSSVSGTMILTGGSTKSIWAMMTDETYGAETFFDEMVFLDFTRENLELKRDSTFTMPEGQKLVKLFRTTGNTYWYILGGNLEDHYYYIHLEDTTQSTADNTVIDWTRLEDSKNWVKVMFDMDDEIFEDDKTYYNTDFGVPDELDLFEEGNNIAYQQYGEMERYRYPKQLSFITSNQQISWNPTRVCRKRWSVYPCGYTWLRIVGSTKFPIDIYHARGTNTLHPNTNNKSFRSSKMTVSVQPLTTLSKDNTISFLGNVSVNPGAAANPIEELRLHSVYFVEDAATKSTDELMLKGATNQQFSFKGFNKDFFDNFFRIKATNPQPDAGKYNYEGKAYDQSHVNYSGTDYKALYLEDSDSFAFESKTRNCGLGQGNSLCNHAQFARYTPDYVLPKDNHAVMYSGDGQAEITPSDLNTLQQASYHWSKEFSPGWHRVHMIVTATHSSQLLEYKTRSNIWRGYQGSRLMSILGPHRRNANPSDIGLDSVHIGAFGPLNVYYQAYTIDFYIPEVSNFSSEKQKGELVLADIQNLSLSADQQSVLFRPLDASNTQFEFIPNSIQEIKALTVWGEFGREKQKELLKAWEESLVPVPTIISSIRPFFDVEKGLAYNMTDFFLGENTELTVADLPDGHSLKGGLDSSDILSAGITPRLNDFPLNLPSFLDQDTTYDGNSKNIVMQNLHTEKAHFLRTNRDGELLYAPQTRLYPLDNLTDTQRQELEDQGLSSSYYKIFGLVTDENGNQLGTPPVYIDIQAEGNLNIYKVYGNVVFGSWKPFGKLKLVQNGQDYFATADKDGNFTVQLKRDGAVSFYTKNLDAWDEQVLENSVNISFYSSPVLNTDPEGDVPVDAVDRTITPLITNYVSGDVVFSDQPIFEGVASPNKEVYYRIYYRTSKPTGIPGGFFEERGERTFRKIDEGQIVADDDGYFAFIPQQKLKDPRNENDLYYIEVGKKLEGRDGGLWEDTSVISVRYQEAFDRLELRQSTTLLPGVIANAEPYLYYDILGQTYTVGMYDGTDNKSSELELFTPARLTLKAGQRVILPAEQQMVVVSDIEQGASFFISKGSQVVSEEKRILENIAINGIFSRVDESFQSFTGLQKGDEIVAPNYGGEVVVVSEELEVIVPAKTKILTQKVEPNTPESLYQITISLLGNYQDGNPEYPSFNFATTRFNFGNLEALYQSQCAQTEVLNPGDVVRGTVAQCGLISEVLYPKSRDPKIYFPFNGSILPEDQKIELMGTAWPNSVLQVVMAGRHVGTFTTDKQGRFYWRAPQVFDFQSSDEMRENGVAIELFDTEQQAAPVGTHVQFGSGGEPLDAVAAGLIKEQFLDKWSTVSDSSPDGFNSEDNFKSFSYKVKHFFQELRESVF